MKGLSPIEERGVLHRRIDDMALHYRERELVYQLWTLVGFAEAEQYLDWLHAHPDAPVARDVESALQAINWRATT
jgi:hypothetical protein